MAVGEQDRQRKKTDNRGYDKPTERQARTEEEAGPEVTNSGPRAMNNAGIGRRAYGELG